MISMASRNTFDGFKFLTFIAKNISVTAAFFPIKRYTFMYSVSYNNSVESKVSCIASVVLQVAFVVP